jgi:hypothetical protein
MNILTHPFHRAISYYWTKLLPEHEFYFLTNEDQIAQDSERMAMRPRAQNVHLVSQMPVQVDVAISHTASAWHLFSPLFPTVHWFHHLPYEPVEPDLLPDVAVYLTPEARQIWQRGTYQFVARHPLDLRFWQGYQGQHARALMVATMPLNWWGDKKGASLFGDLVLKDRIPYKLVGYRNERDWPQCEPEYVTSAERMRQIYQSYRVYGCTSPQIERAALEALAVGMPVVAKRDPYNTLVEEVGEVIDWAEDRAEMSALLRAFLTGQRQQTMARLQQQRQCLENFFALDKVRAVWLDILHLFG